MRPFIVICTQKHKKKNILIVFVVLLEMKNVRRGKIRKKKEINEERNWQRRRRIRQ